MIPQIDPNSTVAYFVSKKRFMLAIILAVPLIGLGVWMAFFKAQQGAHTSTGFLIFGLILIAVFTAAVIVGIQQIRRKTPAIIIGPDGVTDNYIGKIGLIPWSDIASIMQNSAPGQRIYVITVYDPEEYLARASTSKRASMKSMQRTYGSPIWVTANSLEVEHSRLGHELMSRLDYYQRQQGGSGIPGVVAPTPPPLPNQPQS